MVESTALLKRRRGKIFPGVRIPPSPYRTTRTNEKHRLEFCKSQPKRLAETPPLQVIYKSGASRIHLGPKVRQRLMRVPGQRQLRIRVPGQNLRLLDRQTRLLKRSDETVSQSMKISKTLLGLVRNLSLRQINFQHVGTPIHPTRWPDKTLPPLKVSRQRLRQILGDGLNCCRTVFRVLRREGYPGAFPGQNP